MGIIHVIVASLAFVTTICKGFRYNYMDPKIYTFAFPATNPGSLFNGKELIGSRVELMKEVCCRAGKRCDSALVDFSRCWNSQTSLSEVLNGRWYDVCVQFVSPPRRRASYSFSDIPFFTLPKAGVLVSTTSNITREDLLNPRNDIKVIVHGDPDIISGSMLLDVFKEKFFVKPENIIIITGTVNEAVDKMLEILNDPCLGRGVVGIVPTNLVKPGITFKVLTRLDRELGKPTIMVRKDDQHILDWWDYTLKRFICSPDYSKFCERMFNEFGSDPVNCPDPGQVDCSDCSRPHRVPGCPCPGSL